MRFEIAMVSGVGPRRLNEDAIGEVSLGQGNLAVAVADGLGGMGGGSKASQLAIQTFKEYVTGIVDSPDALLDIANIIHHKIAAAQEEDGEHQNMATTLTAAVIYGEELFGVHCGDTRLVVARGDGIKRLTSDHSEGMRLLKAGKISKSEYAEYPRKHILDSALGRHKSPTIDTFKFLLKTMDKIVVSSDGMHQRIMLRELRNILAHHSSPDSFISEVEKVLLERIPEDNYTVAAIFCK